MMTNGPTKLGKEQYNKRIIDLSGTLTKDQDVIFPLNDGSEWLVRNNTIGGHTIRVRGVGAGASVNVSPGSVKTVFTDGISFYG
jgi:hypothetical protein